MCLDRLVFFRSSCHRGCKVLANREEWQVADELVPQEAPDPSLCWICVYLDNVVVQLLLGEKELEEGAAGEGDMWQNGITQLAILHHKAVLRYTLPPLPLHLLLIIILLLLLTLLILLLFKEVWKAFRPSLLSCRDLQDRHCHPPSQG
jgi:hypothetical protein